MNKPVASPVTLSADCSCQGMMSHPNVIHGNESCETVTLSEGQPKSFKSEQCVCGHGSIQHEWEDEFTSCCMAHLRLFNGVGEGKPCMCTGYKPLSEGQETQEKKS